MDPQPGSVTLDEFLAMSSEQRKALPDSIYEPLWTQAVVENLNRNVLAQDQRDRQAQEPKPPDDGPHQSSDR